MIEPVSGERNDVGPIKQYRTALGPQRPEQEPEKRAFADTARTEQHQALTSPDLQIELVENHLLAEMMREIFDLYQKAISLRVCYWLLFLTGGPWTAAGRWRADPCWINRRQTAARFHRAKPIGATRI